MLVPWLATLLFAAPPACVYLRAPETPAASCAEVGPGRGAPSCVTGLPPGVRLRLLADGRVCAAGRLYEPVHPSVFAYPGPSAPLPEVSTIARLCGTARGPRTPRRRWWLPKISVSVERGLWWPADWSGFSVATTVWVSLSFPTPEAPPPSPAGATSSVQARRRRELCVASARLGKAFAGVRDVGLRTRARLQLMAWRDELSLEDSAPWDPSR